MCGDEIANMNIVSHSRSVGCVKIGAEDSDILTFAECRLDRDFDKVRRACRRLAGSAVRVGSASLRDGRKRSAG